MRLKPSGIYGAGSLLLFKSTSYNNMRLKPSGIYDVGSLLFTSTILAKLAIRYNAPMQVPLYKYK